MIISKMNVLKLMYYMVLISLIIDIGGAFGIKNIVFITAFILQLFYLFKMKGRLKFPKSLFLSEFVVFIFLPIILVSYSIVFQNIEIYNIIPQMSAFLVWLLFPLFIMLNRDQLIKGFRVTIYSGVIVIILTFLLLLLLHYIDRMDFVSSINQFSNRFLLGYIGIKPIISGVFVPNVFYRWTFMIIPVVLLQVNNSKKLLLIGIIAILMTLSTGAIFFFFFGLLLIIMKKNGIKRKTKKNILMVFVLVVVVIIILMFSNYSNIIFGVIDKFSSDNISTSVKLGHIESIMHLILSDIKVLIFGTGIGSSFYSIGAGTYVTNVEVSYFNLLRQFGIVYLFVFFAYVFNVYKGLSKTDTNGKILGVGILSLFMAAGTNPLLISPVFFIPLMIGKAYIISFRKELKKHLLGVENQNEK